MWVGVAGVAGLTDGHVGEKSGAGVGEKVVYINFCGLLVGLVVRLA